MKNLLRRIAVLLLLLCLLTACGKTAPHAAADTPALETGAAAPDGEMDLYLAAAACQALNLPPDADPLRYPQAARSMSTAEYLDP